MNQEEKEKNNIIKEDSVKSAYLISIMSMLSKITGFARDLVIATAFGVGPNVDAFLVAFRIPNLARSFFAEGPMTQALIPVLSEYRIKNIESEIRKFLSNLFSLFCIAVSVFVVLGILLSPQIVHISAPGFIHNIEQYRLTIYLTKICFPYVFFVCIAIFFSGVLNSYRKFGTPAFSPIMMNLSMMIFTIIGYKYGLSISVLAFSVSVGGLLQLLVQIPSISRTKSISISDCIMNVFRIDAGTIKILKLMVPVIIGTSVFQISLLVDTMFASYLAQGSVSWLYYSSKIALFPIGIFGVAISTAILPKLSEQRITSKTEFENTIDSSLKSTFFCSIPASCILFILSIPILTTLFNYGKFQMSDVEMTAKSLVAFAIGIPSFMVVKILASIFFAHQDTKTPVKTGIVCILLNIILNFLFIHRLKHVGPALATSCSSTINCFLLYLISSRKNMYIVKKATMFYVLKMLFASIISCVVSYFLIDSGLEKWTNMSIYVRTFKMILDISIYVSIYLLCLLLMRVRIRDIIRF